MNTKKISNRLILFFFALYLGVGAFIAYGLEIYHNDTISRTALAYLTVFGREPHISALGFVWQPLPSLLQIPLLILLKPFNEIILPSIIISSLSGAIAVSLVYRIGTLCSRVKNTILPAIIAILFGLNPLLILHAAIGTSEMLFIACILATSYYLIKWYFSQSQANLVLAGIFIALSFWSRYESIPAFFGFVSLVILNMLILKRDVKKTESLVLQFIIPFCYSVFFWILANFMIMKDPFYFLYSPYSNAFLTTILRDTPAVIENSYRSVGNSILYVLKRIFLLAPILGIAPLLLLYGKKLQLKINETVLFLFLTVPYLAILLFHILQLYKGQSLGWLRFYSYAIVLGTLIAIFVITRVKNKLAHQAIIASLFLGILTTAAAMSIGVYGKEEVSFVKKIKNHSIALETSRTFEDQKQVASYMDDTKGDILIDTDDGFAVPIFSKNPKRYIIRSDTDFESIIQKYQYRVSWIIVPEPKDDIATRNKIYYYYPEIWDGKAPSTKLATQIDGWKIYKVTSPYLQANSTNPAK